LSDKDPKSAGLPEWVNCRHSVERLLDYVDGTLPPEERAKLDRHFKICPPCLDLVKKYRATPGLCRKALCDEMPADAAQRLTAFLRSKLPQ